MRILFLATDAFGGRGGIAQYNRDLITALAEHPGVEEVVAIPRHLPDPVGLLPEKVVYRIAGAKGKLGYATAVLRELRRSRRFALVVCGHINLLALGWLAGRISQAPALVMLHGIDAWQPRGTLTRRLLRRATPVAISRVTAERFAAWSGIPVRHILNNAIHAHRYGAGPKKASLVARYGIEGKKLVLTVGRLASTERYKGFDEVIELLPSLADEVVYLIVGEGADRRRLEDKAKSRGVADRVIFAGYIPEEEKADHFRLADTYVMPSRGEGFGFVFLEALACGIPVVASRLDGGREAVLDGRMGILVDPSDPDALRNAVLEAITRPKAVPPDLQRFSFENFRRRCHTIVEQVTGRRSQVAGETGAPET